MAHFKAISNKYDSVIHGRVNKHFDPKFDSVDVSKDHSATPLIIDDDVYVKYSDVEAMFLENEELRQTLFVQMSDSQEWAHSAIKGQSSHSTSEILTKIKLIETLSKQALTGKEVFNFVYSVMSANYGVNFNECPQNSSKLQWLWREGHLPIVSMLVCMLSELVRYQRGVAPAEFKAWADKIKTLKTQRHRPAAAKPF